MAEIGVTLEQAFAALDWPVHVCKVIKTHYTHESRKYHGMEHLSRMLSFVPQDHPFLRTLLEAVMFHDHVFLLKPPLPPGYSESCSILNYILYSGYGYSTDDYNRKLLVVQAINASAYHLQDQQGLHNVAKWLLDLDLSTFALPKKEFLKTCLALQDEYSPFIGVDAFKKGNLQYLKQMLKRKAIYYLPEHEEWEIRARDNLEYRIKNYDKELE